MAQLALSQEVQLGDGAVLRTETDVIRIDMDGLAWSIAFSNLSETAVSSIFATTVDVLDERGDFASRIFQHVSTNDVAALSQYERTYELGESFFQTNRFSDSTTLEINGGITIPETDAFYVGWKRIFVSTSTNHCSTILNMQNDNSKTEADEKSSEYDK